MSEENDGSTDHVIDWLLYMKIKYLRINETSFVKVDYLTVHNNQFVFLLSIASPYFANTFSVFSDDIKGYWYRRGAFVLEQSKTLDVNTFELSVVKEKLHKYILEENKKIIGFFHNYFSNIPHLGCYDDNFTINKIYNLYQAQKLEILIPDFIITKKKSDIDLFIKKHNSCITKGFDRNGFHVDNKIAIGSFVKLIALSELNQIPDQFNYSFIQQYIDKKADIRIFYIGGKIYSTAIFSQSDEKTKIDFRNYNDEKPNRIVPFKLPSFEEKKVRKLMKILNYETGSIDYLLDKNNDLYFLEINPIGQYGFISNKCNLFLDKVICNYFKKKCNI